MVQALDKRMAYSDFFVLESIKALLSEDTSRLQYEDIANNCSLPCSLRTVIRSVNRLEKAGLIQRTGKGRGNAKGYQYRVS